MCNVIWGPCFDCLERSSNPFVLHHKSYQWDMTIWVTIKAESKMLTSSLQKEVTQRQHKDRDMVIPLGIRSIKEIAFLGHRREMCQGSWPRCLAGCIHFQLILKLVIFNFLTLKRYAVFSPVC